MDEFSGFDTIHSYWHDDSVDPFEDYLKQNGFFVATGSRSHTINSGSEIASRLNLQPYPEKLPSQQKEQGINSNKVMRVLKANGYTTVAIDMYFQKINADINISYEPEDIDAFAADPSQRTFLRANMPDRVRHYFQPENPEADYQQKLLFYSLERTINPGQIQSPKFVYTHLLLPHEPFIFDEKGQFLPRTAHDDWNYYLGQLKYTTQLTQRLVSKILEQADPDNPPVIILQSDHGARNIPSIGKGGKRLNNLLKDFPLKNTRDILNALYLPGFNTAALSNAMDPTDTFAIVLNHYLDAGLEVNYTPVQNRLNVFNRPAASAF